VSLGSWFERVGEERGYVCTVSRLMSGHTATRSHLNRFSIVDSPLCICGDGYETIDHLIWSCPKYESERISLKLSLTRCGYVGDSPIRDVCAEKKWEVLKIIYEFMKNCEIKV
jgi:hypothetical protein